MLIILDLVENLGDFEPPRASAEYFPAVAATVLDTGLELYTL
jgi:hypothetical protein